MNVVTEKKLPRLNARLFDGRPRLPGALAAPRERLPEKVLQFGEGNFLRAFFDWMLDRMNTRGLFGGRAVLVQPIAAGMAEAINAQDGIYTVLLRGVDGGRPVESCDIVSSVSRCIDPHVDYDAFVSCAKNPDLRFIVSNTTEAGIRLDAADRLDRRPAPSFPGKLTQLLYARFRHFHGDPSRGVVMLPCELIEANGDTLKRAVFDTAKDWMLEARFRSWLTEACTFHNTLVDRIVTGYPRDEARVLAEKLGYEDALLVACETFHSWVIESSRALEQELPLVEAGLNVTWTRDIRPYRERKVRILNGAHTMTALAAYLAGKNTVRDCMQDPLFASYIERGIVDEILPTLELPHEELLAFANAVLERFKNPYVEHRLISIALNSVSKFRARILQTIVDYTRRRRTLPPRLTFSLAALIAFYRGTQIQDRALIGDRNGTPYRIYDDAPVLEFFLEAWAAGAAPYSREYCETLAIRVLSRADFWGEDLSGTLPDLGPAVAAHLYAICKDGVRAALERVGEKR